MSIDSYMVVIKVVTPHLKAVSQFWEASTLFSANPTKLKLSHVLACRLERRSTAEISIFFQCGMEDAASQNT